jgi:uncharacterized protein
MAMPVADPAHVAAVEEWREARYARLREPLSWLTLAGLQWLDEGENALGSAPDTDLRLPAGPAVAGRLVREGRRVIAYSAPDGALTHHGVPADGLELVSDLDAPDDEEPTLLELGSLRMCVIRRGDRIGLRVWDVDAPARASFAGIPHYPVGPAWRFAARLEPPAAGETIAIADVIGEVEPMPSMGTVAFTVDDREHRLVAVDGGDGRLWLIFGDATNADTTYGGGRYLYTDPVDGDGTVVVDFNRAYNPPCVFSPYATCPLPPPENRLSIRVEAGEMRLTLDAAGSDTAGSG